MTIRQATAKDASKVAELILLAIKDIGYQLTGKQTEAEVLKQLQHFYLQKGNRFSYDLILVKEIEGKAEAMILCYYGSHAKQLYEPVIDHLRKEKNDVIIDQEADGDEYYIDALAVSPQYQGKGIAKQLFEAAEEQAKHFNYKKIALNVDQTNEKALQLYQKLGYVADKQIAINGRPYWHMSKSLLK